MDDAEIAVIAFGTAGRIAQSAVKDAREEGMKVGLLRPISLYPYPYDAVREVADKVKRILVVEMNAGQMLDDVRLAVEGRVEVDFYGRMGGVVPLPDEVYEQITKTYAERANGR
jgi:2-oxoglutarate ferredoxin oxidoreductase subunit alpha